MSTPVVTDPPSSIGFMNKEWDKDRGGRDQWIAWLQSIMVECLRVLKPGGHAFVWALPRTSHYTALAIEQAGFEIRDRLSHIFIQGFPKSLDASRAIDAKLGAEREITRAETRPLVTGDVVSFDQRASSERERRDIPVTTAAAAVQGWGTALKPAMEDWWLARKPRDGTIAETVLKWGTGAINIDATRIGDDSPGTNCKYHDRGVRCEGHGENGSLNETHHGEPPLFGETKGRWPAHLAVGDGVEINDIESPALYFYCPKPSRSETEAGLASLPIATPGELTGGRTEGSAGLDSPRAGAGRTSGRANIHPTKKPIALMRYLVRMIAPPHKLVLDGPLVDRAPLILDPFAGSGTTGLAALVEGCRFVGFEQSAEYHAIACERLRSIIEDPRQADEAEEIVAEDPTPE